MTRNALAARNNEAYGQGNSPSLSLKTLGAGILLLAVFRLACVQSRPPHKHPFSDFFRGEGAAVDRLSGTDNPVFKLSAEIDG